MPVILYKRQKQIFDFIKLYIEKNGFAPSLKEIADAMNLSSLATVHEHIRRLVEKGVLKKHDGVKRGLELAGEIEKPEGRPVELPIMGYVAAGLPIEPHRDRNSVLQVAPKMITGKKRAYVLQVKGESMIEDGIFDGDYVVIEEVDEARNGEVVVALLENGTVTLKKYFKEETRVRLEPANANMGPIYAVNVQVQGKVVGLIRKFYQWN